MFSYHTKTASLKWKTFRHQVLTKLKLVNSEYKHQTETMSWTQWCQILCTREAVKTYDDAEDRSHTTYKHKRYALYITQTLLEISSLDDASKLKLFCTNKKPCTQESFTFLASSKTSSVWFLLNSEDKRKDHEKVSKITFCCSRFLK